MMKRSKSIEARYQNAASEKAKLLKNIESSDPLKISGIRYHTNRLIELHDISIFYGDKFACRNVDFSIEQGDRIALCGKNGSGKSSILKLICGEDLRYTGDFFKAKNLSISYISQDTETLHGSLTDFASLCKIDESLFKAILRKMDFSRIQFEKDIEDFSGGQKKKVLIAKSLCEKAHLYVWDEPLNYIDIYSRIQIEDLLLNFKPTILFVEHDKNFIKKIATKTFSL